ncbi:N-acetylmuramoyl-L-alanine amidase [Geomicrobium sp. JCM 19038]|uniref:N-acetylmuramoyl-L-alanine amidase n=1 Tax=Geomicrobium sp. JCM 19038 TaxID=1460635 RepID=UPI00045F2341|nr:N-acetylmuramoyl-L-alanine amidase [Geomicrobium sp. JCM 19038]GAK07076.1 N-acetylmuramoyl-L-alanine amidase [Geomicrobium sp. JCM 19038]
MSKKSLLLSFVPIFLLFLFFPISVHAYQTGYVDTNGSLLVRDSANTESPVVGSLVDRQTIEYLDIGNGWGQITYHGRTGYVSLDYITETGVDASEEADAQDTVVQDEAETVPLNGAPLGSIQRIVLDPGHGGQDPGAVVHNFYEKEITLDIANRAAAYLTDAGYNVSLTRSNDSFVALDDRAEYANGTSADIFISIHANASFDLDANGIETYYAPGSAAGQTLANALQSEAVREIDMRDRGVLPSNYVVLRKTAMPAALIEFGFMTNGYDRSLQQTDLMRDQSARAILRAVQSL